MALAKQAKLAAVEATRGRLEHELYNAELDLKVAKAGSNEVLEKGPEDRVSEIQAQLKVLDDEAKEVRKEKDDETD
ncbi:MAG: hypothetical protein ACRDPE_15315 [Solirubrobacterales bacterium]